MEYKEKINEWVSSINRLTQEERYNVIFRILLNILFILVMRNIITIEEADSLVKDIK